MKEVKLKLAYVMNSSSRTAVGYRARKIYGELKGKEMNLERYEIDGIERCLKNEQGQTISRIDAWPGLLNNKSVNWVRLGKRLVKEAGDQGYGLYHFTNQTLSFMAKGLRPSVLTIHDLIELLEPQDKKAYWLNRYLYSGIARTDKLVAVSHYTAETITDYYGVDRSLIEVVYNGADDFYEIDNFEYTVGCQSLKTEYKVSDDSKIILYVGSDHPRKNVMGAARVVSEVVSKQKDVIWLKVGEPGILRGREELLKEIDKLGIRDEVRFVGNVSQEKLNEVYNLADVLIFPSRFEGFGLPPLQAMACGTPVVCSNSTSLPEVVGDDGGYGKKAAATFDPDDIAGMAGSVREFLENKEKADEYKRRGLERVKLFVWKNKAEAVKRVYESILDLGPK